MAGNIFPRKTSSREQRMERIGHGSKWPGRVVPAPFPPAVGLDGMLHSNERDVLRAAHANVRAVRGMPAQRSSAATRTWQGAREGTLTTRSLDPNDALPVVDRCGRYFGHGAAGRLRMIEHAQEVMAGGSVRRVPLLAEVRDGRDPFAEDVRERPHTPIIDGNLRPFRFNVTAGRSEMRPFTITTNRPSTRNEACTPRSGYCSTALDCSDESCSPSPPYLLRKMVLRRR